MPAGLGAAKLGFLATGLVVLALAPHTAPVHTGPAVARKPATTLAAARQVVQGSAPNAVLPGLTPLTAAQNNAAVPVTAPTGPVRPFTLASSGDDRAKALTCLTQAVYYEAGFEPTKGQEAVAQVVLNRVRHPIFPHSVCGVVFQGSELKTGCQFSFTCDGALARTPQPAAWTRARKVAAQALDGFVLKDVGSATHYHTEFVVPWWRSTVSKVAQIGAHIFYRWPGSLGLPGAFNMRYAGNERVAPKPGAPGSGGGLITAPDVTRTADGRVHATLAMAAVPEPRTPRERLLLLASQGALGANFDPAKLAPPKPAAVAETSPPASEAAAPSHAAGQ